MRECDLIMKGGVTSGVAYPGAVAHLASHYRLRSIGGTSAGAIAAVLAAAAEYRRQRSGGGTDDVAMRGFALLADLGRELGRDLGMLFQPEPELARLYDVLLVVATRTRDESVAWTAARALWAGFGLLLVLAALPGVLLLLTGDGPGGATFWLGVLLAVLVPVAFVVVYVLRGLFRVLPANDYGLCTGLSVDRPGRASRPAFTDWMHTHIEAVAGTREAARPERAPLTVGDLKPYGIVVASMTTDLASRRPWQLPLRARVHAFSRAEFARLFPADVLDYLVTKGGPISDTPATDQPVDGISTDLHHLPDGDDMPLVVLARLSLSFPGLVSAVPLYRQEGGGERDGDRAWRRCVFSDGGISSNFPVHFFDSLLPSRPTFGIGFATLDPQEPDTRVSLPSEPPEALGGRIRPIAGLPGFLGAVIDTAKDWQDTLQSRLSGYAERIVEIRLDPEREGGLHVDMDEATVEALFALGESASQRLASEFDFDEHRYRRALALLPKLDASLAKLAENYRKRGGEEAGRDYDEVLTSHEAACLPNEAHWREDPLARLARALVVLGEESRAREAAHQEGKGPAPCRFADGNLPVQDTELRLVASADASPPDGSPC